MIMIIISMYDVDSPDCSDYDEPGDLNGYSDVCGFVGTYDCYVPIDVEFMHELHGSDNCGIYCQLRYDIRPYGHNALTDVEFYHEMHGPDNCGKHCVSRSRAGVTSGVEECDVYAGDVDLLWSGSDKQQCCMFSSVVCASPTGPGGSGNEDSDICECVVCLMYITTRAGGLGEEEQFDSVMCTSATGPGGPGDGDSDICERTVPGLPRVPGIPGVPGVPDVPHGPENCGEKKCVTQSDGDSDICDIGDIGEKAVFGVFGVPGVSGVPGVPDVPHGSENCRVMCVTRSNTSGSGDRDSNSFHSDMCTSPPELGGFGDIQVVYMDALVSDDAGVGNRSFSETPDFASDFDPGPGKPSTESGDILILPDFASDHDPGPGKPSPESGDVLELPDLACDFDPGPGEPLLESGVGLDKPLFAGDVDMLQMPDFVSAIDPGHGKTSPESGDILAVPDFVSDFDPGPGEPFLALGVSRFCL